MILSDKQTGKRPQSDEAQHPISDPSLPVLNTLAMQHSKAKVNLTTTVSSNEILDLRFLHLSRDLAYKDLEEASSQAR